MKHQDLIIIHEALKKCLTLKGAKFAYAVARNIDLLEKAIVKFPIPKPSEDFTKYDTERIALAEKYAEKKEDKSVIIKGRYKIKDEAGFNKEFKELSEKHRKVISEYEELLSDYNKFLQSETDVDLYEINLEDIPQDITVEQMQGITPIIK